jgi:Anti-sigma-K factor rskA, C-terminal
MATHEDDRAAYLAGEDRLSLTADERAELDELRSLLGSPATWAEPNTNLEERVVSAIAEEAAARPAIPRERRLPVRLRRRWYRERPAFALGGLAAAAAAAALAAVLATSNSSPPPQRFAMVVSGTALAPGAQGSATLTRTGSGWRIELDATGLPRLAGGRYYEAWLKSGAGVLVPVGTFNDARKVTLWAGVAPPDFPSFTVTRQRVGGSPASSGEGVLTGAIRPQR